MDNDNQAPDVSGKATPAEYLAPGDDEEKKGLMIGAIVGIVLIIILTIAFLVFLLTAPAGVTERIRDVFIIFLAIQSLLIGIVMIVLIVQLSQLINLLQNEVRPILESTNETVSNLRGTTEFLSDNLVEPVMKANEYSASIRQFMQALGLVRRSGKSSSDKKANK
jgi:heme/copper-type cytochrome/quinol oxidase subunit 4